MDMPITRLDALLQAQRAAWQARAPDCAQRMDDLSRLRRAFKARLEDFVRAVSTDFGHRPRVETLLADGVPVLNEIDHVRGACAAGCARAASRPMPPSFPRIAKS